MPAARLASWYPALLGLAALGLLALAQVRPQAQDEWRSYGSDLASTKYAPLNQIHRGNVADLRIAWQWRSIDQPIRDANQIWTWKYEATPLMIGNVLYTSTSLSQVAAIDATTGETLWSYDPGSWQNGSPPNNGFLHRGVAYWDDGSDGRIYIATGHARLIALNARTGEVVPDFGNGGQINLTQGLRRSISTLQYGVTSPPVICNEVVVVGSSIWDYPIADEMAPGDVRGFDVRTGALRWTFESIPQAGAVGSETWGGNSASRFGNTNVWAPMSCDEDLGLVYLPFSTATNDYYGGERPGDNLFAESLVAVDLNTGARAWHYQMVHHGIWDYDLPAAPNLMDITVGGRQIKAVAQVTKQGFLFVLDRQTGEPVWPIEERPVPASTVPGEQTAPTQPFPTRPAPFEQQGATLDDLIDFTPALRNQAITIASRHDLGPLFTPPTTRGTVTVPGVSGGGSWAGAAVHPATGRIYVPSIRGTWTHFVSRNSGVTSYTYKGSPTYGPSGPQGLPLLKPPYGSITAIDLNSGDHLWKSAVGEGPRDHIAIRNLNLPRLGWARRIFVLLTDSLLFATQEGININRGSTPRRNASEIRTINANPALLAYDTQTGALLASTPLPSNAAGAPMTYKVDGLQYIVVPVGGASQQAELVALTLDPAVASGLPEPPEAALEVALHQSYPNPAADEARVVFSLSQPSVVKLSLYNALGQRIRTIVEGMHRAGSHTATIDVRGLALGTYYYRLETPDLERGGKLVVFR